MPQLKVPDYDDLINLSQKIYQVALHKKLLEVELKYKEKELMVLLTTDPKYFKDGKAPAVNFLEKTYLYSGLNNELVPLRKKFAELSAELSLLETEYEIMRMQIDLFRTESANSRNPL